MSSRRTYPFAAPMASMRKYTRDEEEADKFARREHPVKFSNELVDSLQKNTFVRHIQSQNDTGRISTN